jgi:serine/threonine protein kinase/Flp pilus assembly protein TadD
VNESSADVRSIFNRAQEIDHPDERTAYLDAACGADAVMRAEVDALLAAADQAGSFMQGPVTSPYAGSNSPTSAMESVAEGPGTVIGPYKLLQKIGEGGMGVVFIAEQTRPVQRTVALKIIKPGMDSRQVIARFEAERQALALMDHPNIARVLDAGATETGRPYFVMELVKGMAITQFADERQLTPRERLELFLPVCQAVQHAHQKGVIHRDLKPTNILVAEYDNRAVPKVIDFGVAKATAHKLTERTLFTEFGAIVGTFEYMSPEQAKLNQLDIDTRTDVYSLGVVLYELLTGETPFDRQRLRSAAFDEVLRIIREEEPPKPSTRLSDSRSLSSIAASRRLEPQKLTKLVRGELDWVVMKALEKDRSRRYETASGLAQDISHFLADEPVQAGPPSAAYRVRKALGRHRRAIAGGTLIGLMLLATAGVIAKNAVERSNEKKLQRAALEQRIHEELTSAEAWYERGQFPPAITAIKRAEKLVHDRDDDLARRVRQRVLDLETARRLDEIRIESAVNEWDRMGARTEKYWKAFKVYGLPVYPIAAEHDKQPEVWARLIRASFIQKDLLAAIDDFAGTVAPDVPEDSNAGVMLDAARRADPNPWRQSLYFLLIGKGDDIDRARLTSDDALVQPASTIVLTACYLDGKDYQPYEYAGMRQAVELLRKAQERRPDDFWLNLYLSEFLAAEDDPERIDEAIGYARAAVALRPDSGIVHTALAQMLNERGLRAEAENEYLRAIELDPDATSPRWELAYLHWRHKEWKKALAVYETALPVFKGVREGMTGYNFRLDYIGRLCDCPDLALRNPRRAIELARRLVKANSDRHSAWAALGRAYYRAGDFDASIEALTEATTLDDNYLDNWQLLGEALFRAGRWQASLEAMNKAVAFQLEGNPNDKSSLVRSYLFLAMACARLENYEEVGRWKEQARQGMDDGPLSDQELPQLRAELEALLETQPSDVHEAAETQEKVGA